MYYIMYCMNPAFSPYTYVYFESLQYDAIHHDHIQYDATHDAMHHHHCNMMQYIIAI